MICRRKNNDSVYILESSKAPQGSKRQRIILTRIAKARKRLAQPCGVNDFAGQRWTWWSHLDHGTSAVSCATQESSLAAIAAIEQQDLCGFHRPRGSLPQCELSKQMDPRDALGDLLVDAVVPVLGWPAFYKCSALNRAWRATLKRVGSDLRKRHAPPPPKFGRPLLDLPLFVDRVVPFLGWPGLFGCSRVGRAWNAAVAGRARRALRRHLDRTPTSRGGRAGPFGGC